MTDEHPRHIIAVSALTVNELEQVLMIRNPRRGWEIPGGQVEQGERLHLALQREVLEESGITISIDALGGIYSRINPPYMLLFMFFCRYTSGEPQVSDESLETEWVTRDQVLDRIAHPAIRGRVQDLLAFKGQIIYRVYSTSPYTVHEERYLSNFNP
jgi:8-oxo-dGTP diphosphatase